MPRKSTGGVVIDTRRNPPTVALRFRAYGRRRHRHLGTIADGWTRASAEAELKKVMADIDAHRWRPKPKVVQPKTDATFAEFAEAWFQEKRGDWRPNTVSDYRWQLDKHLLPFFGTHRLTEITVAELDRYRAEKLMEGSLSAVSVRKTMRRLKQILAVAWERDAIPRNPMDVNTQNRMPRVRRPIPVWLDRAEHIAALLDAAGVLDALARRDRQHVSRRATIATLAFAGLRISELLELRWRDIDFVTNRITVIGRIVVSESQTKTEKSARQIDMLPTLRDELLALKAARATTGLKATRCAGPDDLVFPAGSGYRQSASNVRNRVLAPAVKRANERLAEAGDVPLPEGITPHKLRHTFASLLFALGEDPVSVMSQLGHASAAFTLNVYSHAMRRDDASRRALRELVGLPAANSEAA